MPFEANDEVILTLTAMEIDQLTALIRQTFVVQAQLLTKITTQVQQQMPQGRGNSELSHPVITP